MQKRIDSTLCVGNKFAKIKETITITEGQRTYETNTCGQCHKFHDLSESSGKMSALVSLLLVPQYRRNSSRNENDLLLTIQKPTLALELL